VHLTDTAVRRILAGHRCPDNLTELGGRRTPLPYCTVELGPDDVLFMRFGSGGGYGDPLERDPGRVVGDVVTGLLSPGTAELVYGVVIGAGGLDLPRTEERRRKLRQERRATAMAATGGRVERGRPLQENLEICADDGGEWIRCTRCGHVLCPAGEDWTRACGSRLFPPTNAGPLMADWLGRFLLEEFHCPACGILLKTDVVSQAGQAT